ncbi:MAG: type II toxin-antitoxin system RelE/ParE family toxin [Nitrospira defluvii]|nr:type II toxin-antitoxin system RelE/ParE family toxin [Nitrospira defluvii]
MAACWSQSPCAARSTSSERKWAWNRSSAQCGPAGEPNMNRIKLERNRAGQYSISINDQWRLCFRFEDSNAYDVEVADYH